MNKILKPLACTVALGTALSFSALASAGVESSQISETEVVVSYNAYELAKDSGRSELERQIRNSARQVCGYSTLRQIRSVSESSKARACYKKSVEQALKSIQEVS